MSKKRNRRREEARRDEMGPAQLEAIIAHAFGQRGEREAAAEWRHVITPSRWAIRALAATALTVECYTSPRDALTMFELGVRFMREYPALAGAWLDDLRGFVSDPCTCGGDHAEWHERAAEYEPSRAAAVGAMRQACEQSAERAARAGQ